MTAVGKLNPNSTIKEYVRGLRETSPNDRHIMLADIRAALGSEKFSEWYNEAYKLRSAGKHAEYEQAIKKMFDDLHNWQADSQAQDPRAARLNDIEYALNNEPLTKEQANELLDEMATLGAGIQHNPPEIGSAEWFRDIQPIEW